MNTWREALRILLEEIEMEVKELSEITGTSRSTIFKYLKGGNSIRGTAVEEWLEALEKVRPGSKLIFHLACLGLVDHIEKIRNLDMMGVNFPRPKPKSLRANPKAHVRAMRGEERAEYLRAIAAVIAEESRCMEKRIDKRIEKSIEQVIDKSVEKTIEKSIEKSRES